MKKMVFRIFASTFLLVFAICDAWATSYNPATEFSITNNPSGVWTYGYAATPGGTFTPYTSSCIGCVNGTNEESWFYSAADGWGPNVEYNNGGYYNDSNVVFDAYQLAVVAGGVGNSFTGELIFTAPSAGNYYESGDFTGDQYGIGTNVGIITPTGTVFSSSVTSVGEIVPFEDSDYLNAGQQIIFYVSPGSGTQNTGLDLDINYTATPESSSALYLLLGGSVLLGFVLYRRLSHCAIGTF